MNNKNEGVNQNEWALALYRLTQFADPDPRTLSDEELENKFTSEGFDFALFSAKLDVRIDLALRKSKLNQARTELPGFRARVEEFGNKIAQSSDEIRRRIEVHLSGLDNLQHPRAAVLFRQYESLHEEDLPDLLHELEMLGALPEDSDED